MAKSAAERQKEFRERNKGKARKLEVLLPDNDFNLLHDNAKQQGLTKAKYVVSLLHDNNVDQVSSSSSTQIKELLAQVEETTKDCRLAKITIKRLISEKTDPAPLYAGSQTHPDAISLINENKKLVKENNRLTIKANTEHIDRKALESKYDKQTKGLDDTELKSRNDELKAELAAIKSQIKNHTHTIQEYAQLERENNRLVNQVAALEKQSSRDQESLVRLIRETETKRKEVTTPATKLSKPVAKKSPKPPKNCQVCGKEFVPLKSTAKFCCGKCRQANYAAKKKSTKEGNE